MKRIFTLLASTVLAASLLTVPCFAAEPEDLSMPLSGMIEMEQSGDHQRPENTDEFNVQLYDARPPIGEVG